MYTSPPMATARRLRQRAVAGGFSRPENRTGTSKTSMDRADHRYRVAAH
ncbi:hypothetical protein NJ7G_1399 [Natrinema sp. J7-2]|nr:hypothetical protein NJ7G_1399 [Natrinema sp. J7-2]